MDSTGSTLTENSAEDTGRNATARPQGQESCTGKDGLHRVAIDRELVRKAAFVALNHMDTLAEQCAKHSSAVREVYRERINIGGSCSSRFDSGKRRVFQKAKAMMVAIREESDAVDINAKKTPIVDTRQESVVADKDLGKATAEDVGQELNVADREAKMTVTEDTGQEPNESDTDVKREVMEDIGQESDVMDKHVKNGVMDDEGQDSDATDKDVKKAVMQRHGT